MRIFLIGLMGSGKSFWAEKLGAILSIPVFDLDTEITEKEGETVAEIFASKGEQYFRQKENETLKSFGMKNNFILSTGGGTPCFHNSMQWMNNQGVTIWIDEPVKKIAGRLVNEKAHRPLIAALQDNELETFFYRMYQQRKPFYLQAKHRLQEEITEEKFLKTISLHE